MIGSISLPLQSIVSSATTSTEIWSLLATAFGNPTRGHIRQLKHQIKSCTKGIKTISECLRTIKAKADDLALLGKPMDPEDLTEQILAGLGEEYKTEIDVVNGRDQPISFSELHERLLNREAMILCAENPPPAPIVANATDTRSWRPNNNQQARENQQYRSNNNRNHYHNNNQQRGGRGQYHGRCQACGVHGHSAKFCPEFRMVRSSQASQSWQSFPYPPQWHSSPQPWQPRANAAMLSDSSTWLLDSGASHHMTSDLGNLSLHSPYSGNDDVMLGDGSGLQISHTGSFSTPTYSRPFFINNVLCVPSLEKNLISVFQLCTTNGVSVTFTPTYYQVRDLQTGTL